ncbi:MAG: Druantia anti-phage system protein DruA [Candidatus Anammoxibacter sp.]
MIESTEISRTDVARRVCEWQEWRNSYVEAQLSSCISALKSLEKRGHVLLPIATRRGGGFSLRLSEEAVEAARGVPLRVDDVEGLALHKVTQEDELHMRIWNCLISEEHPLGLSRLFGRQMRYLIGSSHGWLGGISFSAAALKLKAREEWICWNEEERKANLQKVANMSRFLIRPGIECKNLASKVLGLSVRQVQEDWVERYGEKLELLDRSSFGNLAVSYWYQRDLPIFQIPFTGYKSSSWKAFVWIGLNSVT